MPSAARAWRGLRARSWSSKRSAPERSGRCPMIARIRLVLPAPLRPTRPTMLPAGTSSEKPRSASTEAIVTCSAFTLSISSLRARDVAAHVAVAEHLCRRAVGKHAAAIEGDDPRGVARHDVHVVLDEQHRGARLAGDGTHDRVHERKLLLGAHAAG